MAALESNYKIIEIPEYMSPYGVFEVWVKRALQPHFDLHRVIKNLITKAGKAALANIEIGAGTAPTHIAIGTGTTAASLDDTTLQTEIYRGSATRARVNTTWTNDTAQYSLDQAIGGTYAISEAGLLNNSSGGDLYSHQVFTAVTCYSGDIFRTIWKFIN
jgi:hypothetical protein